MYWTNLDTFSSENYSNRFKLNTNHTFDEVRYTPTGKFGPMATSNIQYWSWPINIMKSIYPNKGYKPKTTWKAFEFWNGMQVQDHLTESHNHSKAEWRKRVKGQDRVQKKRQASHMRNVRWLYKLWKNTWYFLGILMQITHF